MRQMIKLWANTKNEQWRWNIQHWVVWEECQKLQASLLSISITLFNQIFGTAITPKACSNLTFWSVSTNLVLLENTNFTSIIINQLI